MGMPSGTEADPSVLLAVAVPLMFGYMFGDVGQGLVIAAAGFALRRRWPMARLFIAGGLAAAVFGLLFGSVFSLHLLHPVWVAPLDDPLAVLLAPLVGGAVLLTGRPAAGGGAGPLARRFRAPGWAATPGCWSATSGCCWAFVWSPGWLLAVAGALWFCIGHGVQRRSPLAVAAGAGRTGRAAAADPDQHAVVRARRRLRAGPCRPVVGHRRADGRRRPPAALRRLVLVLGNVVVIVLEGLVVSIQTTRLVLFEFFTRFLEAQGPGLPPPAAAPFQSPQEIPS